MPYQNYQTIDRKLESDKFNPGHCIKAFFVQFPAIDCNSININPALLKTCFYFIDVYH